jgi:prepilin-type N-terminal cleavage/methylation domain-containing protein
MIYRLDSHRVHKGFTIVELAVVIMVIGILAAVSFFGYNAWRDRVATAELKSDLSGVQTAMASAGNWGSGYPALSPGTKFDGSAAATRDIFTQSKGVTLTFFGGDAMGFWVDALCAAGPSIIMYIKTATNQTNEATLGSCASAYPALASPTVSATNKGTTVELRWTAPAAKPGVAVATMQTRIDNGAWQNVAMSGMVTVGNGYSQSHSIQARAVDSIGRTGNTVTASATTNPAPPVRAFVSKGAVTGSCTPATCYAVTLNTQNFPAGNYSVVCMSTTSGAFSTARTYVLPANGSVVLSCYHGAGQSAQVYVDISGWGQSERSTW